MKSYVKLRKSFSQNPDLQYQDFIELPGNDISVYRGQIKEVNVLGSPDKV